MKTEVENRPQTETGALFGDLDKPSLVALSYVLRHPDTWPEGFYWNYELCSQCAMGIDCGANTFPGQKTTQALQ